VSSVHKLGFADGGVLPLQEETYRDMIRQIAEQQAIRMAKKAQEFLVTLAASHCRAS